MGWMRRVRGAVGMGITWAVAWAIAGVALVVASRLTPFLPWEGFFRVFDAPAPALAIPAFVGGCLFSLVLGVAAPNRRFDELSLPGFTLLGAAGGVLLSLVPAAMVAVGLASLGSAETSLLRITLAIAPPLTLLCAASAAGTLWMARRAQGVAAPDEAPRPAELRAGEYGHDPVRTKADRERR